MAATTRARPIWDKASEELVIEDALEYFLSDSFIGHYKDEVEAGLAGKAQFPTLTETSSHPDTSHISVIDGKGLAVSLTTTAGEPVRNREQWTVVGVGDDGSITVSSNHCPLRRQDPARRW